MKKKISILFLFIVFVIVTGCESLLENELPANQVPTDEAIKSSEDLQKLLNASYDVLANSFNGNGQRFAELLADNVTIVGNSGFLVQVYNRSSDFFNSDVGGFYSQPYTAVVRANSVLENIDKLNLSEAEKNRFEGEAKFIRGVCHFELVRLFAQPYGYTPDNSHLGIVVKTSSAIEPLNRNTVAMVYQQILSDLKDAETLLLESNTSYADSFSAKAYLAKAYFQMNDFVNAASKADEVIANAPVEFSDDINNRYGTEISSESLFSTVSISINDNRGSLFKDMYRSVNANPPTLRVSDEYFAFLSSNTNDLRSSWVESKNYASISNVKTFTKFDSDYMNVCQASLTEIMLISAESHGELNTSLAVAEGYLNQIKDRADIPLLNGAAAETIIMESRNERKKEFAGEGHRLHDLKRIGVLGESVEVRGAPWDCNGMVLQFPASENSISGFKMNPQGGCN